VSPAAKRRSGIEMVPVGDSDEDEADALVLDMQKKLRSVPSGP
jgi:hypothetical protein